MVYYVVVYIPNHILILYLLSLSVMHIIVAYPNDNIVYLLSVLCCRARRKTKIKVFSVLTIVLS
jgi:hypothetical protein